MLEYAMKKALSSEYRTELLHEKRILHNFIQAKIPTLDKSEIIRMTSISLLPTNSALASFRDGIVRK